MVVEVEIRVDVVDVDADVDVDVDAATIEDDVELGLEVVVIVLKGGLVKAVAKSDALVVVSQLFSVPVGFAPSESPDTLAVSILGGGSLVAPLTESPGSCPSKIAPGMILLTFVSGVLVKVTTGSTESEVSLDSEAIVSDPQ